ncbi:MAG TPA: HAD family hydrolase [Candidatus Sulfotelmatobacter sp.]|jgi:phosphoglycolate phosphatase|nr:HAD family hydrolase [Candidatus Sulfotelmatobacter sp.]
MTAFPRLAVFDVDGTLIDSQHNIISAMTQAWAVHGLGTPRPDAVRRIIGLSLVEAVARLLPEPDDELAHRVAHSYKEAFQGLRLEAGTSEPLFPGAVAALDALEAEGWLLGLATGKSRRGVDAMIERHGFQGRFVTRQTADDNPGKPHPAMLLRAMSECGADADATVMIGDTAYDMLMARQAGAHALGVVWGYHPPEDLTEAGAHHLAEDYAGVPTLAAQMVRS